jgi:hypothetical protein
VTREVGQVVEAAIAAGAFYVVFAALTGTAVQFIGRRVQAWPIRGRTGSDTLRVPVSLDSCSCSAASLSQ